MGEDTTGPPGHPSRQRVSVDVAARALGLSVDAVRKRAQRGTIEHEKDAAGRVRILLDSPDNASTLRDERPDTTGQTSALVAAKDETIEELREQTSYLQGVIATRDHELRERAEEIRRRDSALERQQELTAMFANRLRELEAPQASQESPPDTTTPQPEREAEEPAQRRPWWRRIFGG